MNEGAQNPSYASPETVTPGTAPVRKARVALIKRLADVVSLPSSRVNAFERSITSDLLVEILREAGTHEKRRVAQRVAQLTEIPEDLLRTLLIDELEVAEPLLTDAKIPDSLLILCASLATEGHRRLIARRRDVSELVVDGLARFNERSVTEALLRNTGARFTQTALEGVMAASRHEQVLLSYLLRRPELRPSHAYIMFWWCEHEERKVILQRFAVGRDVLQDAVSDVFSMAAAEDWNDPLVRKALQFIERRQRNRAAQARSAYADLDTAVMEAEQGLNRQLAQEIGYMAGLKPTTAAKIFTDPGGEALAVLCKATGLSKARLLSLWRSMRRPERTHDGAMAPGLARTMEAYDMMAVDRAQTVLRYWNWALTSSLTPALLRAAREGVDEALEQYSLPERSALLALGSSLKR